MNNTRQEILRIADQLIRNCGFNSFSYTDISIQLNIKNAAIHYYFPTKADLGIEVIKLAAESFAANCQKWSCLDKRAQYQRFVASYNRDNVANSLSLVSALSVSYDQLTHQMQSELKGYIAAKHRWLSNLLAAGKNDGTFALSTTPDMVAYMVQSHIFSSLALGRIMQDNTYLDMQKEILNMV